MTTFQNNKKKGWFSHEAKLVFMHGIVFKDRSRNSATFKMELFAKIGNSRKLQRVLCNHFNTQYKYEVQTNL